MIKILPFTVKQSTSDYNIIFTRAPIRRRLTPPATLAQGKEECN